MDYSLISFASRCARHKVRSATLRGPQYPLRAASTNATRGRDAILEKRPDDIVITFAKRTAMGRAKKGQLKDVPVDELMHAMFKVCLKSRPLLGPNGPCLSDKLTE